MPKKEDLTNQIFGLIQCISPAESKSGKTYWNCKCIKCGAEKIIQTTHFKTGVTKTCGCGCKYELNQNKEKVCIICGKNFIITDKYASNRKYCYDCVPKEGENISKAELVSIRRKAIKKILIDYAGGKCQKCGYNKCDRALEFHHLNPKEKDFGISRNITRDLDSLKKEIDKCILLCSNCHAEEHERLEHEKNK